MLESTDPTSALIGGLLEGAGECAVVVRGGRLAYANAAARRWLGLDETHASADLPPWLAQAIDQPEQAPGVRRVRQGEAVALAWPAQQTADGRALARRDADERLRAALDASGTGTFRWQIDTGHIDSDPNLKRLFGLSEDHPIDRIEAFVQRVHPDDRARVNAAIDRCVEQGENFDEQFRIVLPDGGERSIYSRGRTACDQNGKAIYMTGACVDVTHRHESLEHARRLAAVFEASQDAITGQSLDGIITDWNPGAEEMYGYTRAQAVGQSMRLLATEQAPDEPFELIERVLAGQPVRDHLTCRRAADGRLLDVSLTLSPVRDAGGRVVLISSIARDVTQQQRDLRRIELLSAASAELAASLDYEATLEAAAHAAVPGFADWCVVDIVEGDRLRRVALAHEQPEMARLARQLRDQFPSDENTPGGSTRVTRTGEPEIVERLDDSMFRQFARSDEHLAMLRQLKLRSYICVPLAARGRVLGALTFVASEPRPGYERRDLDLAQEIARRAAQAIENAQLHRELTDSRSRYRHLLHAGRDAIFVYPVTEEGEPETIVEVNNAACERLGYSRQELLKMRVTDLTAHPLDDPRPAIRRLMYEGGATIETEHRTRDGRVIPVEVSGRPLDLGGRPHIMSIVRDISERKRTELALRESESRFRQLADAMPQLVWTGDPDGTVDYYNSRWREFAGFKQAGESWSWSEALHPDDLQRTAEAWQQAIQTGEQYQVEHRVRTADGDYRWYLSRAVPVRDASGRIIKWYGTATDVHDAKLTEQALRESELRLSATFENAAVGIAEVAPDGRWLRVNQRLCEIVGYSRDELLERRFQDLTHPEDVDADIKQTGRMARGEIDHYVRHKRYIRKDGRVIWINLTAATVRDPASGELSHFAAVIEDISEQVEGEWALAEATRRQSELLTLVESMLEHAPVGLAFFDRDLRFVRVNHWLAQFTGQSREAYTGRPLAGLAPEFDRQMGPVLERVLAEGQPRHEVPITTGEGQKQRHWLLSAYPVEAPGAARLVGAVVLETTQRVRAEAALRRFTSTLEQRVAERSALAERQAAMLRRMTSELATAEQRERRRVATTLHDHLQQILVAAKFGLDRLRARTRDDRDIEAVEQVEQLIDQSIQASRTLTVELAPPVLYDRGLVAALQWLARHVQQQHGLAVSVELDEQAEPQDEDIRAFLFQSARELLFNVVKHAQTDRAWMTLGLEPGSRLRLSVRDGGCGVTSTPLDPSEEAPTGFGLFSIQQRLQLLGGKLEIDSTPGSGCEVTLWAPVGLPKRTASPTVEAPPTEPTAEAGGARRRVLLVDDHRVLRDGLARIISAQPGLEVVAQAGDGVEALELARKHEPDVVVMDVTMPRMDGLEATRQLKQMMPDVRVVGLSMHEQQDMARAMLDAGADAYATKGGPVNDLVDAIRGDSG